MQTPDDPDGLGFFPSTALWGNVDGAQKLRPFFFRNDPDWLQTSLLGSLFGVEEITQVLKKRHVVFPIG